MTSVDYISELPTDLIQKILSFLNTRDAIRASYTSPSFMLAWQTSPIIDVDETSFLHDLLGFIDYGQALEYAFYYRYWNVHIQKFKLRLGFIAAYKSQFQSLINDAIMLAQVNNVEEIDLNIGGYFNYAVPIYVFSAKSIVSLSLAGYVLGHEDLIVCCPLLENFIFSYPRNLNSIKVSCPNLKSMNLMVAGRIQLIDIEAKNLESLQVCARCEVKASNCTKLRHLRLQKVSIKDISMFKSLEVLSLRGCTDLQHIYILTDSLRRVELQCFDLRRIFINSENLKSFEYIGGANPCDIEISDCELIQSLTFESVDITDTYLKNILFKFPLLQNLKLTHCRKLNDVDICHQNVQTLELSHCDNLVEVDIICQKLTSLVHSGSTLPSIYVFSGGWHGELLLTKGDNYRPTWYVELKEFLISFAHCKELTLRCKDLIFPMKIRERWIPPLLDLKSLKLEKNLEDFKNSMELLDSVLWATHRPESLSFGSETLKFKYTTERYAKVSSCCERYHYSCWRHAEEIWINKFPLNMQNKLLIFFYDNAKSLKKDKVYTS